MVLLVACCGTALENHFGFWRELEASQVPDLSNAFHMVPLAPCHTFWSSSRERPWVKTPGRACHGGHELTCVPLLRIPPAPAPPFLALQRDSISPLLLEERPGNTKQAKLQPKGKERALLPTEIPHRQNTHSLGSWNPEDGGLLGSRHHVVMSCGHKYGSSWKYAESPTPLPKGLQCFQCRF